MATKKVQVGIEVDRKGATKGYKAFADDVSKQNKRMRSELQKTKQASQGLGVGIKGLVAAAGGLFIFSKVNNIIRESISLAGEQASAEAKVEQTIRSTGQAAGITADEMKRMAQEFQNVTTFGDEVILRGQSMLLTFKQIGKDVFPAATESMLNLSVAMGTDVKESAIQLGKALNDPITGLTALRRVGITFSKEQENLIKNFQKSGEMAKAQTLILQELESQFGGLAKSVALTGQGPLIQFQNIVSDVQELLGEALIPVIIDATAGFKEWLIEGQKSGDLVRTFEFIANGARLMFGVFQDVFSNLRAIFKVVSGSLNALAGTFLGVLGEIIGGVDKLQQVLPERFRNAGITEFAQDLRILGQAGLESGQELFEEGIGSVSLAKNTINAFKAMGSQAKETTKDLNEVKGAAGLGPVSGGTATDPKADAAAAKKAAAAEKAAQAEKERLAKERQAFIDSESQKFEEALAIREEFRRMNLSQADQDLLAFQDDLKIKNALLREAGLEEIDIIQMVANKRQELNEQAREAQIATARAQLSDFVGNLEAMAKANKKFGPIFKAAAVAQATIDTFAGATAAFKALAGIPIVGPALGAAAAAAAIGAGIARVAQIKAQKFQGGGVVDSGQLSGDRVPVLANRGEMILNATQQRNLFALANGQGGAGNQVNFNGNIVVNSGNGDPDEIAQAVNRTMQERLRDFSKIQNEKDALLVR